MMMITVTIIAISRIRIIGTTTPKIIGRLFSGMMEEVREGRGLFSAMIEGVKEGRENFYSIWHKKYKLSTCYSEYSCQLIQTTTQFHK